MRSTKIRAGWDLRETAEMLVAAAPSHCYFNGLRLRAKYATTCATDIEAQYHRVLDAECYRWEGTPAGIKWLAKFEERLRGAT